MAQLVFRANPITIQNTQDLSNRKLLLSRATVKPHSFARRTLVCLYMGS